MNRTRTEYVSFGSQWVFLALGLSVLEQVKRDEIRVREAAIG